MGEPVKQSIRIAPMVLATATVDKDAGRFTVVVGECHPHVNVFNSEDKNHLVTPRLARAMFPDLANMLYHEEEPPKAATPQANEGGNQGGNEGGNDSSPAS